MNWIQIARPGTLLASLCPVCISLCAAGSMGSLDLLTAACTLIAAVGIQILSNFFNDYYDFKKGADTEGRIGPKRAISEGWVSARQMIRAITIAGAVTIAAGCVLVFKGGWPILGIGLSGLLLAWLYTATRFSLSYLGIADLFVLVYFGPVATVGTYYLQRSNVPLEMWMAGICCGLISMAILTINNLRDVEQDRKNGKKTIIVRIGIDRGQRLYLLLLLTPIVIAAIFVSGYTLLLSPIAIVIFGSIASKTPQVHQRALIRTALYLLLFSVVWVVLS